MIKNSKISLLLQPQKLNWKHRNKLLQKLKLHCKVIKAALTYKKATEKTTLQFYSATILHTFYNKVSHAEQSSFIYRRVAYQLVNWISV